MSNNQTIDGVPLAALATMLSEPRPDAPHCVLEARAALLALLDAPAVESELARMTRPCQNAELYAERLRADVAVKDANDADAAGKKVSQLLVKRTTERDKALELLKVEKEVLSTANETIANLVKERNNLKTSVEAVTYNLNKSDKLVMDLTGFLNASLAREAGLKLLLNSNVNSNYASIAQADSIIKVLKQCLAEKLQPTFSSGDLKHLINILEFIPVEVAEVIDMKYGSVRFHRKPGDESKPYLQPGTKLYARLV